MDDKQVYYDTGNNQLYWIEWQETGNSDIPTRHYIGQPGNCSDVRVPVEKNKFDMAFEHANHIARFMKYLGSKGETEILEIMVNYKKLAESLNDFFDGDVTESDCRKIARKHMRG